MRGPVGIDGLDIETAWTQEVLGDAVMVAFEPDSKSRVGAARFVGRSTGAGRALVVIAYRDLEAARDEIADGDAAIAWEQVKADLGLT